MKPEAPVTKHLISPGYGAGKSSMAMQFPCLAESPTALWEYFLESLDLKTHYAIMRSQRMPKKSSVRKKLTRHEQRDLDIEIGFLEGVVKRDAWYVEALQILGDDYTRRGRYRDGLRVDERLAQLRPEDSLVLYNLACSYSLTDQVGEALSALERALSLGYRDFKWLAEDPDLRNVRRHPLFQKIRAKLRTLQIKVR
jgi:tetratricopeptide (TPR) repeat protein